MHILIVLELIVKQTNQNIYLHNSVINCIYIKNILTAEDGR